jgi:hypothetical protein
MDAFNANPSDTASQPRKILIAMYLEDEEKIEAKEGKGYPSGCFG